MIDVWQRSGSTTLAGGRRPGDNPKWRYPKLLSNSSQDPKFRSVRSQRKTLTQGPQRIQNDRDIDRLLKQGAFDNRKVTEGGSHHRSQRQGQTYIDTL